MLDLSFFYYKIKEEYDDMINKIRLMRPWVILKDLLKTDVVMVKNFTISESDLNLFIIYRQAIRDIPDTLHNQWLN